MQTAPLFTPGTTMINWLKAPSMMLWWSWPPSALCATTRPWTTTRSAGRFCSSPRCSHYAQPPRANTHTLVPADHTGLGRQACSDPHDPRGRTHGLTDHGRLRVLIRLEINPRLSLDLHLHSGRLAHFYPKRLTISTFVQRKRNNNITLSVQ